MTSRFLFLTSALSFNFFANCVLGADDVSQPKIGEIEPVKEIEKADEEVSLEKAKIRRTTVFDEVEIKKLYKDYKARNEKMSEGLPAHLNTEEMELVTLKTLNVGGDDLKLQRDLIERLDPKPRRRLERIADIDPDAANEMLVTMRNDQEFMSGQYDRPVAAGDPGRPANFTASQIGGAFDKLITAIQGSKARRQKEEENAKEK